MTTIPNHHSGIPIARYPRCASRRVQTTATEGKHQLWLPSAAARGFKLTRRDQAEEVRERAEEDGEPAAVAIGVARNLLDERLERDRETLARFVVALVERGRRQERLTRRRRDRGLADLGDLSVEVASEVGRDIELEGRLRREERVARRFERGAEQERLVVGSVRRRVRVVELGVLLNPEVEVEVLGTLFLEREVIFEISQRERGRVATLQDVIERDLAQFDTSAANLSEDPRGVELK